MKLFKKIKFVKEKALELRKIIALDCYERYVVPFLPPEPVELPELTEEDLKVSWNALRDLLVELFYSEEYGSQLEVGDIMAADGHRILSSSAKAALDRYHGEPLTPRMEPGDVKCYIRSTERAEPWTAETFEARYIPHKEASAKSAHAQVLRELAVSEKRWLESVRVLKMTRDPDVGWVSVLPAEDVYPQEDGTEDKLPLMRAKYEEELTADEQLVMCTNITNYMRQFCYESHTRRELAKFEAQRIKSDLGFGAPTATNPPPGEEE